MKKQFIAFALLGALLSPASAQTSVTDAWVRGTVPAQKATGAFMRIVSQNGARLIQADSSVADVVEIVPSGPGLLVILPRDALRAAMLALG